MTVEQYYKHPGCNVICTIKAIKGNCVAGHKVGDKFELNGHITDGLCGALYHTAYPYIRILQHGGTLYGEDVLEIDCPDRVNAITMEMRTKE